MNTDGNFSFSLAFLRRYGSKHTSNDTNGNPTETYHPEKPNIRMNGASITSFLENISRYLILKLLDVGHVHVTATSVDTEQELIRKYREFPAIRDKIKQFTNCELM
eukprot:661785-Amorphochlora_amoeboformis.AAC.2